MKEMNGDKLCIITLTLKMFFTHVMLRCSVYNLYRLRSTYIKNCYVKSHLCSYLFSYLVQAIPKNCVTLFCNFVIPYSYFILKFIWLRYIIIVYMMIQMYVVPPVRIHALQRPSKAYSLRILHASHIVYNQYVSE